MNTNILFLAFLFLMVVNTIIAMATLIEIRDKKKEKTVTEDPELTKCKIALMQLFSGINKLTDLLEGKGRWTKLSSMLVIKAMDEEAQRITNKGGRNGLAVNTYPSKHSGRSSVSDGRS
uniref:Uncharacterized protein n=2 Tax=viral metagenome TaxID=1070528 RepID=A0A6H2A5H7_9ZZZZ